MDDSIFMTFDVKCQKSELALAFAQWHTAKGSTGAHFQTPAHQRWVLLGTWLRNISD